MDQEKQEKQILELLDWSPVGTTGFGYFQSVLLLGSTGLPLSSGGGQGYFLQDGKVSNFLIDERYRDVMVFLSKCYAAGLISEEVLTQDYSAYQSAARGPGDGVATVGFTWGWTRSDRFGPEIYEQYEAMPALAQKAGQTAPVAWSYDGFGENFPANQIVVSASTPNKEAALKVLNAFYDQEMSLQVLFGDIGPNIEKVDESTYKVLPAEDGTDPSTWKWTSTLADNGPMWIRDDITVEAGSTHRRRSAPAPPPADATPPARSPLRRAAPGIPDRTAPGHGRRRAPRAGSSRRWHPPGSPLSGVPHARPGPGPGPGPAPVRGGPP